MRPGWLGLVIGFAACAPPPSEPPSHAQLLHYSGDTVLERSAYGGAAPGASPNAAASLLYLSFGGENVQLSSRDYAPNNESLIAGNQFPPFDGSLNAPRVTQQDAIDAVVDRVRTFYAPYNVDIVTSRPSAAPFTMVVVGGTHTLAGEPSGVAGVSPLDCGNANPNNLVFDFSNDQTPNFGGVVAVAITAAHESGHSFGLEHIDNPNDVMYSVGMPMQTLPQLFGISFTTTGQFSSFNAGTEPATDLCNLGPAINNDALLKSVLGPSARSDNQAPMLDWTFPTLQPVTPTFPISFTASDNVSVRRIEIYKNLELVAVLRSPPYTATMTVASGEAFYLTAEALDDAANRTSVTRTFVADAKNPTLCPDGSCPSGHTCKSGLCRLPLGSPCTQSVECTTSYCVSVAGQKQCTSVCSASLPCPENGTCMGTQCVPSMQTVTPKNLGDPCALASECASGRCQLVCVAPCDSNNLCSDPATMCAAVDGGMGCIGGSTMQPSGGCAFAPIPPSTPWLALLGLALALSCRRRALAARSRRCPP